MSTHTIRHRWHLPETRIVLGLAAGVVALGTTYVVAGALGEDTVVRAPAQQVPAPGITEGARDSWEGRIGPGTSSGSGPGVRDSWMPPGATDLQLRMKLETLR